MVFPDHTHSLFFSSEAHEKVVNVLKQPQISGFADKCIFTGFYIILFLLSIAADI